MSEWVNGAGHVGVGRSDGAMAGVSQEELTEEREREREKRTWVRFSVIRVGVSEWVSEGRSAPFSPLPSFTWLALARFCSASASTGSASTGAGLLEQRNARDAAFAHSLTHSRAKFWKICPGIGKSNGELGRRRRLSGKKRAMGVTRDGARRRPANEPDAHTRHDTCTGRTGWTGLSAATWPPAPPLYSPLDVHVYV